MNIKDIENKISNYAQSYYEGNPEISDDEFDNLVEELREKKPDSEVLSKIGWGSKEYGKKYPHDTTIGSLGKIKDIDLMKYKDYVITPKIDGASVICYYENGNLVRILTRGDGVEGRDVTSKLASRVPNKIGKWIKSVRGECAMKTKVFNKKYSKDFKHPRNLVSGILNLKEFDKSIVNDIDFVAYKIVSIYPSSFSSDGLDRKDILETLRIEGFIITTPYDIKADKIKGKSKDEIIDEDYFCDGLVISNNEIEIENGIINYSEIAYKFEDQIYDTTIEDIHWSHSSGKFIPIADVTPTEIDGGTIRNVLLYNMRYLKDEGIGIGSKVGIIRANEIIPKVVKVHTKSNKINEPEKCQCFKKLIMDSYGTNLICSDPNCWYTVKDKIFDFIKLINNDEDPIGQDTIDEFIDLVKKADTLVDFIVGIQCLKRNAVETTSARSIIFKNLIRKIKAEVKFEHLIKTEIENIGTSISKKLSEYDMEWWKDVDNIKKVEIERFPDRVRDALVDNHKMIMRMFKEIKNITFNKNVKGEKTMQVAVTGAVSMVRKEFEKLLESKGIIFGSIKKDTNYLICNEPSDSSKYTFAQKNGIPIVTEKEFYKIIGK